MTQGVQSAFHGNEALFEDDDIFRDPTVVRSLLEVERAYSNVRQQSPAVSQQIASTSQESNAYFGDDDFFADPEIMDQLLKDEANK